MSKFIEFKNAIQKQFDLIKENGLFVTSVTKDELWDTYLHSFAEGTNPIYKERTTHDCQCCKQFIRTCGNVVSFIDGEKVSIWDIKIDGDYQIVADTLSKLVKHSNVKNEFLHYEKHLGTDNNKQLLDSGEIKQWEHFYYKLPLKFVISSDLISTKLADSRSNKETLERALNEITIESINTVLELIEQKSLYRGDEHKRSIDLLLKNKKLFDKTDNEESFLWKTSIDIGRASKIRNSAIGTLLVDLSEGKELDYAVSSFEKKVAPENYKRPTALVTKSMIASAQKEVKELGIESALQRRYAKESDITINNILFANREVKKSMDVFDELQKDASVDLKKFTKVEEVSVDTFINDILPKAEKLEVMFENKHSNNLMSLIAPEDIESKNILKWKNNFSWSYNGEVADSMKERVAKAGGDVTGILRFSIQWNDGDNNQNDFDAHCIEPDGNIIYYAAKHSRSSCGRLDVDIISPRNKVAVENITWSNTREMLEGKYHFLVHNYSHNGGRTGFTAEIEYDGDIYSYAYNKELRSNEKVTVAKLNFSKENGIKFIKSLESHQLSKDVWNIKTNTFQNVSMIMNSPNYWDDNKTGNKHLFFMLEDCKNEDETRGLYNEFLSDSVQKHRKVFEVLGSKLKVKESNDQLSGVGFSLTKRSSLICKISGSFTRIIKINF